MPVIKYPPNLPVIAEVGMAARIAARKVLGNNEAAIDDVEQHTIYEYLRARAIVEGPEGWAYTVALHQATRLIRRQRPNARKKTLDERKGGPVAPETRGNGDSGVWIYGESQATEADPALRAETKEVLKKVADLIGIIHDSVPLLPEYQRIVVEHAMEGMSLREIAGCTGRSYDSIRKDWSRAVVELHNNVNRVIKDDRELYEVFGVRLKDAETRHRIIGAALRQTNVKSFIASISDDLIDFATTL